MRHGSTLGRPPGGRWQSQSRQRGLEGWAMGGGGGDGPRGLCFSPLRTETEMGERGPVWPGAWPLGVPRPARWPCLSSAHPASAPSQPGQGPPEALSSPGEDRPPSVGRWSALLQHPAATVARLSRCRPPLHLAERLHTQPCSRVTSAGRPGVLVGETSGGQTLHRGPLVRAQPSPLLLPQAWAPPQPHHTVPAGLTSSKTAPLGLAGVPLPQAPLPSSLTLDPPNGRQPQPPSRWCLTQGTWGTPGPSCPASRPGSLHSPPPAPLALAQ